MTATIAASLTAGLTEEALTERLDKAIDAGRIPAERRDYIIASFNSPAIQDALGIATTTIPTAAHDTAAPAESTADGILRDYARSSAGTETQSTGDADPGADPADEWDKPNPVPAFAQPTGTPYQYAGGRPVDEQLDATEHAFGGTIPRDFTATPGDTIRVDVSGYKWPAAAPRSGADPEAANASEAAAVAVLTEASTIVAVDRRDQYGSAERNLGRIADMWTAYLGHKIEAHQVAWCMVLAKASRDANRPHRDNSVDAAAYAALAVEVAA